MPILDRNLALIFRVTFDILSNTSLPCVHASRVPSIGPELSRQFFKRISFDPVMFHYHRFISRTVQLPLFISLERACRHGDVVPKSYFPCIYHSAYREGTNQYLFFFVPTPIIHSYTHRQPVSRSYYHNTLGSIIHQVERTATESVRTISNSDFPVGSKPIAKKFRK